MSSEHNGEEKILVGSEQSIPISHKGCGKIPYSSISSFLLNDVLYVPNISHNLLFVNRLCKPNNCYIVFYADKFTIQDKTTNNHLFQGPSVNDLYRITLSYTSTTFTKPIPENSHVAYVGIQSSHIPSLYRTTD